MRIAMKRDTEPGPCETLPFGEIEDYHVIITDNFNGDPGGFQVVQLEGTPSVESIDLFGLVNAETAYSYWVLEKTISGSYFEIINKGSVPSSDVLFLKEQDNDPSDGINLYRLSLFDKNDQLISQKQTAVPFQHVAVFDLFPNPASQQVSIQLSDMIGKNVRIEIYNRLGQPMYRKIFQEVTAPIHSINTSDWKDGIYQVMVFPEKGKMVSKQLIMIND